MSQSRRSFASDNVAPVAPEVMAALLQANTGTVHSYGDDPWTARLQLLAREVFETELAIYPVATGTAANALALATLTPPAAPSTATQKRTSTPMNAARLSFTAAAPSSSDCIRPMAKSTPRNFRRPSRMPARWVCIMSCQLL